jgi:hypothetical protein
VVIVTNRLPIFEQLMTCSWALAPVKWVSAVLVHGWIKTPMDNQLKALNSSFVKIWQLVRECQIIGQADLLELF